MPSDLHRKDLRALHVALSAQRGRDLAVGHPRKPQQGYAIFERLMLGACRCKLFAAPESLEGRDDWGFAYGVRQSLVHLGSTHSDLNGRAA